MVICIVFLFFHLSNAAALSSHHSTPLYDPSFQSRCGVATFFPTEYRASVKTSFSTNHYDPSYPSFRHGFFSFKLHITPPIIPLPLKPTVPNQVLLFQSRSLRCGVAVLTFLTLSHPIPSSPSSHHIIPLTPPIELIMLS